MKYPALTELYASRQMIDVFGGYNHNLRIGEGEFFDMENLTSDDYPVLSPRSKRGVYKSEGNPQGIIAKDSLCYVDGTDFIINEYRVPVGLSTRAEDCPKSLISMGAYVIIMPDKKYVDTINFATQTDFSIEASYKSDSLVEFELCNVEGEVYSYSYDPTEQEGHYWMDTSRETIVLKRYSEEDKSWMPVQNTYVKISTDGIGKSFAVGDGVIIYNLTRSDGKSLANTPLFIEKKEDNYIMVKGIIENFDLNPMDQEFITIKRQMPNMDFIIESNNRLWGCRYGVALNGQVVNEIYASKQGDFKNWNSFAGISTDSYAVSLGSDGQFTGAITHLGYPLFFKENCVHKVYGNMPSNYQIQTTPCRGVQKGCSESLAIVNETLFYKSRSAICAYDGSLPQEISSALGDMSYGDAVAGSLGNKYYISMRDANEQYHLFVFDTSKRMWHREDNTKAEAFCTCRGNLYYIERYKVIEDGETIERGRIKTVRQPASDIEGVVDESSIKWRAVTGVIGTDAPDKKYISRLVVRMSLEVGAKALFYIDYDSVGAWEHLFTMSGTALTLRSFSVPIKPKRCDHMRIRIEGEGVAKIYSICKTIEQGSDA